jgi:SAM-dependent methyltransferase
MSIANKKLNKHTTHLKLYFRNCPICNSSKKRRILKVQNWKKINSNNQIYAFDKKYCICLNCNLIYTSPTVKPHIFDKLYENSIVGSFFQGNNNKNNIKIKVFKKIAINFLKKDDNILEIGSGNGVLLKFLSKKYKKKNLLGIEPSKKIYDFFKKNKYFKIRNIFLNKLSDKKKFNFIIMDNVFEHFEYPSKCLKKISKILQTNGLIYIAIPNSKKLNIIQNDPFNHTCNYNINNIKILLNNNNFKILKHYQNYNQIYLVAKKQKNRLLRFKNDSKFLHIILSKIKLIKARLREVKLKIKKIKIDIISNKKKIVIFGSGNYALWILDLFKIDQSILYGVDNNVLYHNRVRNNIKIYHPRKLLLNNYDYILILSGMFKSEIINQIKKMNIDEKKILTI